MKISKKFSQKLYNVTSAVIYNAKNVNKPDSFILSNRSKNGDKSILLNWTDEIFFDFTFLYKIGIIKINDVRICIAWCGVTQFIKLMLYTF